jgi:hypothetical protein
MNTDQKKIRVDMTQFSEFQPQYLKEIARKIVWSMYDIGEEQCYPRKIIIDTPFGGDGFSYSRRHLNTIFEYLKENGVLKNYEVSVIDENKQSDDLEFFLDKIVLEEIDYDRLTQAFTFFHQNHIQAIRDFQRDMERQERGSQNASQGHSYDLEYREIKISSETLKCEINGYSVDLKTGEEINAGVLLMELIRLQQNGEAVKDREGFGNRVFQKAKQFKTRREVKNFSKFLSNATTKLRSILRDANSCCE